jgi:hypothetical protein
MRNPQIHVVTGLILLLSACSKSSLVEPTGRNKQTIAATVTTQATTPVGTVIYSSNGYTLTVQNKDATFDDNERARLVNTFFTVYPQELNRFNTGATKSVKFIIDPAYTGVAATGGGVTTLSSTWFHNNPEDIDVVTHEVMHIVQAYTGGNPPGWLVEGIADYARYIYGVNNAAAGWSLPAWSSSQSYTDAYRVTARFLRWLQLHKRSTIVDDLDKACRNRTYTANTWVSLTGETVDQLWADYSANPTL